MILILHVFDEPKIQSLILFLLCLSHVHSRAHLELVYDSISVQFREATNSLHYLLVSSSPHRINSVNASFSVQSFFTFFIYIYARLLRLTFYILVFNIYIFDCSYLCLDLYKPSRMIVRRSHSSHIPLIIGF